MLCRMTAFRRSGLSNLMSVLRLLKGEAFFSPPYIIAKSEIFNIFPTEDDK